MKKYVRAFTGNDEKQQVISELKIYLRTDLSEAAQKAIDILKTCEGSEKACCMKLNLGLRSYSDLLQVFDLSSNIVNALENKIGLIPRVKLQSQGPLIDITIGTEVSGGVSAGIDDPSGDVKQQADDTYNWISSNFRKRIRELYRTIINRDGLMTPREYLNYLSEYNVFDADIFEAFIVDAVGGIYSRNKNRL